VLQVFTFVEEKGLLKTIFNAAQVLQEVDAPVLDIVVIIMNHSHLQVILDHVHANHMNTVVPVPLGELDRNLQYLSGVESLVRPDTVYKAYVSAEVLDGPRPHYSFCHTYNDDNGITDVYELLGVIFREIKLPRPEL